ncbi:hypothetical protein EBZ39_00360 [bacterium]|nr:hypothetical protein [bacterium]
MTLETHSKQVIFDKDDTPKSLWQKFVYAIEHTKIGWWVTVRLEWLRRSWAYAKFGWCNYDFDAAYALALLSFKLKRVERVLKEDAHTVQEPKHMQALRLVIRLLDKLVEDDYRYFYETHNKKWFGCERPEIRFEQIEGSDLSQMLSASDDLPADQQEQASEEARAAFDADDAIKARDKRWAFSILAKYYEYWWD